MSSTGSFYNHLCEFVGETVTIYTTSGGQSGYGFTGVILFVNDCFVRLITCIGPAPGCALGSECTSSRSRSGRGWGGYNVRSVGSVVDIPLDKIASFVHNAV